ncbi:MAG: C10 family peptidase [Chitinispirillales bacterium]|nr:C10 family peptidase [Chitinispirillales bacterium]
MHIRMFYIVLLLCFVSTIASPVSFEIAQKTANNYLRQVGKSPMNLTIVKQKNDASPFFVFSMGQDKGFVIVSANDVATPILGDADEGNFNDNDLPPALVWLLGNYENYINEAVKNNKEQDSETKLLWEKYLKSSNETRGGEGIRAANFLIKTEWNQSEPYNLLAPQIGEKRSWMGCIAVSMGQVMNYWEYPEKIIQKIPAYTSRKNLISMPEVNVSAETYDYNNMLDKYTSKGSGGYPNNSGTTQENEVAKFLYHTALGMQMNWGTDASTGFDRDTPLTLARFFDYDSTTMRIVSKYPSQITDEIWKDLIIGQIENNSPIICDGQNHSFIIDGYDPDNSLIHLNYGYGGSSNGWYAIDKASSAGTPERMTINIMPNQNGNAPSILKVTKFDVSTTASSISADFSAKMHYGTDFLGKVGLAIVSVDSIKSIKQVLDSTDFTTGNTISTTFGAGVGIGKSGNPPGTYYNTPKSGTITKYFTEGSLQTVTVQLATKRGNGNWTLIGETKSVSLLLKEEPKYTITFNSNGGNAVADVEVEESNSFYPQDEMLKDGFTFAGWFTDEDFETEWTENSVIVSDTTLYAKWIDDDTGISGIESFDGTNGIIITKNPVIGDFAEFIVKAPAGKYFAKLTIFDNLGNAVRSLERQLSAKDDNDKIKWDLRNNNKRAVAAGTYLALVECKGADKKTYRYYTKFGVKK